MVIFLMYSFVLVFLTLGFYKLLKKYLSSTGSRGDDYYLLMSIAAMFFNYLLQFFISSSFPLVSGVVLAAKVCELLAFWGLIMYIINQTYFKKIQYFRLHKLFITLGFVITVLTILIFSNTNITFFTTSKLDPMFYPIITNGIDFVPDFVCFVSSIIMLFVSLKIKLDKKGLLTIGMLFSSATYLSSNINILFFLGTNILLYLLSKVLGVIAVSYVLLMIIDYYNRTKK